MAERASETGESRQIISPSGLCRAFAAKPLQIEVGIYALRGNTDMLLLRPVFSCSVYLKNFLICNGFRGNI